MKMTITINMTKWTSTVSGHHKWTASAHSSVQHSERWATNLPKWRRRNHLWRRPRRRRRSYRWRWQRRSLRRQWRRRRITGSRQSRGNQSQPTSNGESESAKPKVPTSPNIRRSNRRIFRRKRARHCHDHESLHELNGRNDRQRNV